MTQVNQLFGIVSSPVFVHEGLCESLVVLRNGRFVYFMYSRPLDQNSSSHYINCLNGMWQFGMICVFTLKKHIVTALAHPRRDYQKNASNTFVCSLLLF